MRFIKICRANHQWRLI
ncbi:hypothetical protein M8C21_030883, partial [Ambrosia artemisiifolia]